MFYVINPRARRVIRQFNSEQAANDFAARRVADSAANGVFVTLEVVEVRRAMEGASGYREAGE